MGVLLGVDGGGTKTLCVCLDRETGEERGRAQGPASNLANVGREAALAVVRKAAAAALEEAGETWADVDACVCCMAGIDSPAHEQAWARALRPLFPNADPARLKGFQI